MVKKAVYFVGILCLSILVTRSVNGENIRDHSGILNKTQKSILEKITIDFKASTGIEEILFIGDVGDLKFITDSLSKREGTLILFVVDVNNRTIYVDVNKQLEESLKDSVATKLFQDGSLGLFRENRIYEAIYSGLSRVNSHFSVDLLDKKIERIVTPVDSVKKESGFRLKNDPTDENMARKKFALFIGIVCIIFFVGAVVLTVVIGGSIREKNERIVLLKGKLNKTTPFVVYLSTKNWPTWAQKKLQELDSEYSSNTQARLIQKIIELPTSSLKIFFFEKKKIEDLEERMRGYEAYYGKLKKVASDVELFSARAGNALQEVQIEIEKTGDNLRKMNEEGFGTQGFNTRLIGLRGDFKNLVLSGVDSHRECFIGAYKIHFALLQLETEMQTERDAKNAYENFLVHIEELELVTENVMKEYQNDYKKWANKYSTRVMSSIKAFKTIEDTFLNARREVDAGSNIITGNAHDKYTKATECLKNAQSIFASVQLYIKAGRQAEEKVATIRDAYAKRYASAKRLIDEVYEVVFDSDFPMNEGHNVGYEVVVADLYRSMERVVAEAKDTNQKTDWLLIDIILTSVETSATDLLASGKTATLKIAQRHGIDLVSNEIQSHNPFGGFGK